MTKIYACLIENWVCLNDDPNCLVGDTKQHPNVWWEESAPLCAPAERSKEREDSFYGLDYINLYYDGKSYRINPLFIQIVTE